MALLAVLTSTLGVAARRRRMFWRTAGRVNLQP
jgi:hypothetical protein